MHDVRSGQNPGRGGSNDLESLLLFHCHPQHKILSGCIVATPGHLPLSRQHGELVMRNPYGLIQSESRDVKHTTSVHPESDQQDEMVTSQGTSQSSRSRCSCLVPETNSPRICPAEPVAAPAILGLLWPSSHTPAPVTTVPNPKLHGISPSEPPCPTASLS